MGYVSFHFFFCYPLCDLVLILIPNSPVYNISTQGISWDGVEWLCFIHNLHKLTSWAKGSLDPFLIWLCFLLWWQDLLGVLRDSEMLSQRRGERDKGAGWNLPLLPEQGQGARALVPAEGLQFWGVLFLRRKWKDVHLADLLVFFLLAPSVAFLGILCHKAAPGPDGSFGDECRNCCLTPLRKAAQVGQKETPLERPVEELLNYLCWKQIFPLLVTAHCSDWNVLPV